MTETTMPASRRNARRSSRSRSPRDGRSSASPPDRRCRPEASLVPPLVEQFLLHLATERGLARNTLDAYRRDLADLHRHLASRRQTFTTASADDYRGYLQSQSRAGQSTRTVARRLAAIRVFLRYLSANGIETNHILQQLERPRPERSLPKVLSRSQVNQLIAAPDPQHPLFARDVAILELLYASGLRASELCDLKTRDLNLTVGVVRVFGKGAKERIVPVGQAAIEAITRYLADCRRRLERAPSEFLFLSRTGKPLERVGLWMLVEKYARSSGLLNAVSPHTLRHCFATHLIGGGADLRVVQELLGHSDISTTQIYTHVDQDRLKAIHRKYHPRR